jgi:hypothetical protein
LFRPRSHDATRRPRYAQSERDHPYCASAPTFFIEDTPTTVLVRQVLEAVSQFEKAMLVAKLRGARESEKAITGKCGGRKNGLERSPDAVARPKSWRGIRSMVAVDRSATLPLS